MRQTAPSSPGEVRHPLPAELDNPAAHIERLDPVDYRLKDGFERYEEHVRRQIRHHLLGGIE